jgi:hypothetical protein
MRKIRDMWQQLMGARYTRELEAEVARLRAENRALLNSILGIAGVPPITVTTWTEGEGGRTTEQTEDRALRSGLDGSGVERLRGLRARGSKTHRGPASTSVPVRRRSWHQINQALEIESARKTQPESQDGPELGIAVKSL